MRRLLFARVADASHRLRPLAFALVHAAVLLAVGSCGSNPPRNACLERNGGCDRLTTCTWSGRTAVCGACPEGYSGDGETGCVDVDECALGTDGCDALTMCVNTAGSFVCTSCPAGYSGTGATGCSDVDECTLGTDACDPLVACTNVVGGYACGDCPLGYAGGGVSGCVDLDECATLVGACDALTTCTDTDGGYTCSACPAGYIGDGKSGCIDVDECAAGGVCDGLTTCVNTPGSATCTACPGGYSGDGLTGCMDLDECTLGTDACDPLVTCGNTSGGYTCGDCPLGYAGGGVSGCVDLDECATLVGACDALTTCTDTDGGYTCSACPSGYTGDGKSGCVDVDECQLGTDACTTLERCLNTVGGYACTRCGNGVVELGEACDDGNTSFDDTCLPSCHSNVCGDGFVLAGVEACDDGNSVDGDACNNACEWSSYRTAVLTSGPVAYWPFDEVGGTTALDIVGGRVATIVGSAQLGAPSVVSREDSARSVTLWRGGYLEVPNDSALSSTVFTIEAWARDDATTGLGAVVSNRSNTSCADGYGYILYSVRDQNRWDAYTGYANVPGCWNVTQGAPRTLGRATHLVLTYDGSTMRYYTDGVLTSSQVLPYRPSTTASFRIGAAHGDLGAPDLFWVGTIDEVAFYDRALDPGEIASHHTVGRTASWIAGATATQSSEYCSGCCRPAVRAIDGTFVRDGGPCDQASHTSPESFPYWQVDLGQARPVARVLVWAYAILPGYGLRYRAAPTDPWTTVPFGNITDVGVPTGFSVPIGAMARELRVEWLSSTPCTGTLNQCSVSLSEVEVIAQ